MIKILSLGEENCMMVAFEKLITFFRAGLARFWSDCCVVLSQFRSAKVLIFYPASSRSLPSAALHANS